MVSWPLDTGLAPSHLATEQSHIQLLKVWSTPTYNTPPRSSRMECLLEYPQHPPLQVLNDLHSLDLGFEKEIIPGYSHLVPFGQSDRAGFHWSEVLVVPPRRMVPIGC